MSKIKVGDYVKVIGMAGPSVMLVRERERYVSKKKWRKNPSWNCLHFNSVTGKFHSEDIPEVYLEVVDEKGENSVHLEPHQKEIVINNHVTIPEGEEDAERSPEEQGSEEGGCDDSGRTLTKEGWQ